MVRIWTTLAVEVGIGIVFAALLVVQETPGQLISNMPTIRLVGGVSCGGVILAIVLAALAHIDSGSLFTEMFRHPAGVRIGRSPLGWAAFALLALSVFGLVHATTYLALIHLKLHG